MSLQPGLSESALRRMRNYAGRYARLSDEADDLVQDVLLAAISQNRKLDDERFLAWAFGAIRLRASFVARTAARRRRRDSDFASCDRSSPNVLPGLPECFLSCLPPSLQILARLVVLGMDRQEIAYLLAVPDTALRQRIRALRRAIARSSYRIDEPVTSLPATVFDGLRRRALRRSLQHGSGRRIAIADPDGQNILLAVAHVSPSDGNKGCMSNRSKP
jgi:DNA-directed RNA polymerase specialized sigma24 family protein